MQKHKFLEHTADIKFQAFGNSLEEVFSNCATALSKTISNQRINSTKVRKIKIKGSDLQNLLYTFLEEFLFLFDSEGFILSEVLNIKIDSGKLLLDAEISGDSAGNYKINSDVKAITYNEMFIRKEKNKWVAQVVLDV